MKTKLNVNNLCYSYHTLEGETQALLDISFDVKDGEFFCYCRPVRMWKIYFTIPFVRTYLSRRRNYLN